MNLYNSVRHALLISGRILKAGSRKKKRVTYKSPTSPVTQVDRRSEKAIIRLIKRRFPHHQILAEESAFYNRNKVAPPKQSTTFRWIIDPLDGTVNFMHGVPQSCISIAVEKGGQILVGGIYDPFRDELFMAEKRRGAKMNGRRIAVTRENNLERALLITGFPYNRRKHAAKLVSMVKPFFKRGIDIRRFGAAALDLAWIACGRAEGFWEYNLNPWDVAAGWLIVEEAGGRVTDFSGNPLQIDQPTETLATNGLIHREMIRMLSK